MLCATKLCLLRDNIIMDKDISSQHNYGDLTGHTGPEAGQPYLDDGVVLVSAVDPELTYLGLQGTDSLITLLLKNVTYLLKAKPHELTTACHQ